jgi:hypothetical protein
MSSRRENVKSLAMCEQAGGQRGNPDIEVVEIVEGRLARGEGGRNEALGHRRDFRIVTM